MKISILSKELIKPSSATPSDLKIYKLSFIDQQIPPYYIPIILYYSYNESTNITQSNTTLKLKTSLSETLTHFYPLAGRLIKNQGSIECTGQGVLFTVTRVKARLLDVIDFPKLEEISELVSTESSYVEEQLAVQVNLFDCGGIAVGVCLSHRIADGFSFSLFVNHWFATARGEKPLVGPVFDSAALFPPMGSYEYKRNPTDTSRQVRSENLVTKRFVFGSSAIARLKQEVVNNSSTPVHPTRVEVVTALIWNCGLDLDLAHFDTSVAFHVVNFRKKTMPSLHEGQFGNLFQMAFALTNGKTKMATLVGKLRDSFRKITSEYVNTLMGENGAEVAKGNFKEISKFMCGEGVSVFRFSSWCRFSVNESDFGWGKPVWVSSAEFNDENCIILMDSRRDTDGIEAWVTMKDGDMKKFEKSSELQAFIDPVIS